MKINYYEILHNTNAFVNQSLKDDIFEDGLSEALLTDLMSSNIFSTRHAKKFVESMMIGQMLAYHAQLRKKLLEFGIDIEEMDI